MRDLTIIYDDFGRPYLDQPKWEDIHVHLSISHEKDYAIAQALAEAIEK
jgi:phosphopantetheinyl transferase (holo-ACP synthase)